MLAERGARRRRQNDSGPQAPCPAERARTAWTRLTRLDQLHRAGVGGGHRGGAELSDRLVRMGRAGRLCYPTASPSTRELALTQEFIPHQPVFGVGKGQTDSGREMKRLVRTFRVLQNLNGR